MNYEMCCKSQLLLDAATHRQASSNPSLNGNSSTASTLPADVVLVGDEECRSTKEEIGSSPMGWFSFGPYIEDDLDQLLELLGYDGGENCDTSFAFDLAVAPS